MKKLIKPLLISAFLLTNPQKAFPGGIESSISDAKGEISQVLNYNMNVQEMKSKFGFDVKYLDGDGLDAVYDIDYYTKNEINEVLGRLYIDVLSKYPKGFIKSAYLREIYLFKDIKDKKGNQVGGFELRGKIYLNTSLNNIYKFHHELFHRFDNKDGENDDKKWEQLFGNIKRPKSKIFSPDMDNQSPGYVNIYGLTHGVNEDQATIAEYLLTPNKKEDFLLRLKEDEVLRKKSMIITGAFFDPDLGKFSRNLTLNEYKYLSGFSQYEYYMKWGNGKIDFNFWN